MIRATSLYNRVMLFDLLYPFYKKTKKQTENIFKSRFHCSLRGISFTSVSNSKLDMFLSFVQDIKTMRDQITRVKGTDRVPILLVGNKVDLESQREVMKRPFLYDIHEYVVKWRNGSRILALRPRENRCERWFISITEGILRFKIYFVQLKSHSTFSIAGSHRGGNGPGSDLGLRLRRIQRQESDQRQRGVCRDRARDEPQAHGEGQRDRVYVLRHILVQRQNNISSINWC